MVIKMKSILFKTLFKNIRYKRRAYSNLQSSIALYDLTLILKCTAFLFRKSRNLNSYFSPVTKTKNYQSNTNEENKNKLSNKQFELSTLTGLLGNICICHSFLQNI